MGTLYVVSTPIGNLEDISIRAIRILYTSDVIACEDTRHTGLLLSELQKRYAVLIPSQALTKPVLKPYYDEIESKVTPEIIQLLENGKNVSLVSDAGTPLISDPGFTLIRECHNRHIPVIVVPGASALTAALPLSGLPADKIFFLGYPPEKESARTKLFLELSRVSSELTHKPTYIAYCAPHKLTGMFDSLDAVAGNIHVTCIRELTKIHEESWQGTISEAKLYFTKPQGGLSIRNWETGLTTFIAMR